MDQGKIYITVLLFVSEGEKETFHRYEENVLPILRRYNGELLYRLRPGKDNFLNDAGEKPYEIHVVTFNTKQDFENYKLDELRLSFNTMFKQSVTKVIIIEGFEQ